MIRVAKNLLIGDSDFAERSTPPEVRVGGALNVAIDLKSVEWLKKVEYAHVGLIDGPGNEIDDYCAAVLCLRALRRRNSPVLVYDHSGGRALVVAAMALNLAEGQIRPSPTEWSHWPTWAERMESILSFVDSPWELPCVHEAHTLAFNKMPWGLLEVL